MLLFWCNKGCLAEPEKYMLKWFLILSVLKPPKLVLVSKSKAVKPEKSGMCSPWVNVSVLWRTGHWSQGHGIVASFPQRCVRVLVWDLGLGRKCCACLIGTLEGMRWMLIKRVSWLCWVSLKLRLHRTFSGGYWSCVSECWDRAAGKPKARSFTGSALY